MLHIYTDPYTIPCFDIVPLFTRSLTVPFDLLIPNSSSIYIYHYMYFWLISLQSLTKLIRSQAILSYKPDPPLNPQYMVPDPIDPLLLLSYLFDPSLIWSLHDPLILLSHLDLIPYYIWSLIP